MTELPDWALSNIEEGCGPLYSFLLRFTTDESYLRRSKPVSEIVLLTKEKKGRPSRGQTSPST
jgi:hypothetical protein